MRPRAPPPPRASPPHAHPSPQVNEDFFQKTLSGGIITVVAYAFMLLLFLTETRERGRGREGRRAGGLEG
jgi:hypothetical protein